MVAAQLERNGGCSADISIRYDNACAGCRQRDTNGTSDTPAPTCDQGSFTW